MAISPATFDAVIEEVRRIYADAELKILEKTRRRLEQGITEDGWAEKKLSEIRVHQAQIERIVDLYNEKGKKVLYRMLVQGYLNGMYSADSDLYEHIAADQMKEPMIDIESLSTNITPRKVGEMTATMGMINVAAITALAEATIGKIDGMKFQILRSAMDTYRSTINRVLGAGIAGVETRRQIAQRALNDFANQGVGAFISRDGRRWDIASYTEMATRAGVANAQLEGHTRRVVQQGRDLVIVSDHPRESSLCRPWERKILSISGNHPTYPSLAHARSQGLFHANCRHNIVAYIEGLTEVGTPEHDPDGEKREQRQRQIERTIRQWKKREMVAMDDRDKKIAQAKIREWQQNMRDYLKENPDLRRSNHREQVHVASLSGSAANAMDRMG